MAIEYWEKVNDLFHSALQLEPSAREAFFDQACAGDQQMREEVESLLIAHDKEGSFIDSPAYEAAAGILAGQEYEAGDTITHYEILSLLGKGGMGEVYLAQDTNLKRSVALKVLPLVSAHDEHAQKRLLREAQTAATLDHPNICAIYEVGEENARGYIAMQYVEGETLDARMKRGHLSANDALGIASQVADALAEAHRRNLVHRDIKPSNIMITSRGHARVLDFGLAKTTDNMKGSSEDETMSMLSTPGMILGTVAYMSPEQVRGEHVDERTDIFSFGIVLYEMLSGARPFAHDSAAETIGAILHTQPPGLSSIDSEIPQALEHVVGKCLAKNKEHRYQNMREVADDLSAVRTSDLATVKLPLGSVNRSRKSATGRQYWYLRPAPLATVSLLLLITLGFGVYRWRTTSPAAAAIDSIAVLPLSNRSSDQNMEYLSDGITENLINNLSQLPKLKVKSRNAVSYYKGKETDAQKVGKELGVRTVLKGDVQQIGDQLVINVELVDASDNDHIWGQRYTRDATAIIATQNEIAREIADNLKLRLSDPEKAELNKRPTENVEAYKLYLKGHYFGNKEDPASINQSINFYRQALDLDPTFALAYSDMAMRYLVLGMYFDAPREAMPKAKESAKRALEIDSGLSDPHAVLGIVALLYNWDWEKAKQELTNNGVVVPRNLEAFTCTAHLLESTGRTGEAERTLHQALEDDPLSIPLTTELGCNSYYARRFDESVKDYRDALKLEPHNLIGYYGLGRTLAQMKQYQEAISELDHVKELFGQAPPIVTSETGYAYAKWGKREQAVKILQQLNDQSRQIYVDPYFVTVVYLGLGDKDQAFAWLEKAYQEKSPFIPSIFHEPKWDALRSDSRFKDMMKRLGVPS